MYTATARFYDLIYRHKDYAAEVETLHTIIQEHQGGTTLLDVACGTGGHIAYLKQGYQVEGLDLDANGLLQVARGRFPDVTFHQGDMVDFDLGRQFDVLVCLFSSIGYVQTVERLKATLRNFARHIVAGGVIIVEPWLRPEVFQVGTVHAIFVDEPELKIARITRSQRDGLLSVHDFHYLIATPEDGVQHFVEAHRLALFDHDDYLQAFEACGLQVWHEPVGLTRRGLYIGIKPK